MKQHMSKHTYKPTIGLEIHAELKTETKMFCNSKNDPDETNPNVNICPVCMAHPGTLPVINKKAVEHVVNVGLAVDGEIADYTEFDRKNYFYPDIPKGYQISQYKHPIVQGGVLEDVALTRIHLEEDTAGSIHKGDHSNVDFNRAGIPLMELVTEPVIHSSEKAGQFARALRLLLRSLDAGRARMEKGEMRVEANISVSKDETLGTKVEVKNLNSFKSVEAAIEFEIKRQIEVLEKGESVVQETRGWDENRGITFSQRLKEEAHDYRYFPDPDLPKLKLSEVFNLKEMKGNLPELPRERKDRYVTLGISIDNADLFISHDVLGPLFEDILTKIDGNQAMITRSANYLASDVAALLKQDGMTRIDAGEFVTLMSMLEDNSISSRGAKDIITVMHVEGGEARHIAEDKNLLQESNEGVLRAVAQSIVDQHPSVADEYRSGKEASLNFLVGQGMKETKGSANPEILQTIFKDILS